MLSAEGHPSPQLFCDSNVGACVEFSPHRAKGAFAFSVQGCCLPHTRGHLPILHQMTDR